MPNITTTLYLSEECYNEEYLPRKKEICNKMRNIIRKELGLPLKPYPPLKKILKKLKQTNNL